MDGRVSNPWLCRTGVPLAPQNYGTCQKFNPFSECALVCHQTLPTSNLGRRRHHRLEKAGAIKPTFLKRRFLNLVLFTADMRVVAKHWADEKCGRRWATLRPKELNWSSAVTGCPSLLRVPSGTLCTAWAVAKDLSSQYSFTVRSNLPPGIYEYPGFGGYARRRTRCPLATWCR